MPKRHFATSPLSVAAEEVKELAQIPLEAVATAAGKRLWMSEFASGNYPVSDIRTGLDLSTQVHPVSLKGMQS